MTEHARGHTHSAAPEAALREGGRRLTPQRAMIWEILRAEPDTHLSAEEVAVRVHERMPQVNASTVYRNLDVLVEDGLVLRTDLGESRAFFELAHEHAHHHLVCESCGAVDHVHDDVFADVPARIHDSVGFRVGGREVTLHGICRQCADAARDPRANERDS